MTNQSGSLTSEARHLATELVAFVSSDAQPWFTPLMKALAGVDGRTAERIPAPGLNSVWAVVNHMSFWMDLVLRRLKGEPVTDAEAIESGWSLPSAGSEAEWRRTCREIESRAAELARLIGELRPEELAGPWAHGRAPRWQLINGLINHTSHHIADVLTARHLLGTPAATHRSPR